jgi:uncharacterized protein (DUF1778 family)
MPNISKENERLALRISMADKAKIMRASALSLTDMTGFIVETAVKAADKVIEEAEHLKLSRRDSMRVLELLDHPPSPNARLKKAAQSLPA